MDGGANLFDAVTNGQFQALQQHDPQALQAYLPFLCLVVYGAEKAIDEEPDAAVATLMETLYTLPLVRFTRKLRLLSVLAFAALILLRDRLSNPDVDPMVLLLNTTSA